MSGNDYGVIYRDLVYNLGRSYDQLEKLTSPRRLPINIWESLNPLNPLNLEPGTLRQDLIIYRSIRLERQEEVSLFTDAELFASSVVNEAHVETSYRVLILKMLKISLFAINPMIDNAQGYLHNLWE